MKISWGHLCLAHFMPIFTCCVLPFFTWILTKFKSFGAPRLELKVNVEITPACSGGSATQIHISATVVLIY